MPAPLFDSQSHFTFKQEYMLKEYRVRLEMRIKAEFNPFWGKSSLENELLRLDLSASFEDLNQRNLLFHFHHLNALAPILLHSPAADGA